MTIIINDINGNKMMTTVSTISFRKIELLNTVSEETKEKIPYAMQIISLSDEITYIPMSIEAYNMIFGLLIPGGNYEITELRAVFNTHCSEITAELINDIAELNKRNLELINSETAEIKVVTIGV